VDVLAEPDVVPLQLVVLLATEDVVVPEQDVDVADEVVVDWRHDVELTAVVVVALLWHGVVDLDTVRVVHVPLHEVVPWLRVERVVRQDPLL